MRKRTKNRSKKRLAIFAVADTFVQSRLVHPMLLFRVVSHKRFGPPFLRAFIFEYHERESEALTS